MDRTLTDVLRAEARFFASLPMRALTMLWVLLFVYWQFVLPQSEPRLLEDPMVKIDPALAKYTTEYQVQEGMRLGRLTQLDALARRS